MQHTPSQIVASNRPAPPTQLLKEIEAGYWSIQEGRHQQALDSFLAVAEKAPQVAAAWHGLGLSSEALGSREDGVRFLRKACLLSESTAMYWRDLGRVNLGAGDVE